MKNALAFWVNQASKIALYALILTSLFFFWSLTTENFETPKLLMLLLAICFLLILTALRFSFSGRVLITRTPLDLPLLLLVIVAVVSTILSPAPFLSLLGSAPVIQGSAVAVISYLLLYFLTTNALKGVREVRRLTQFLVVAGVVLSAVTLLSYFGIKILPASLGQSINFTPTGSSFSTTAILALLVPIAVLELLTNTNLITKLLNALFLALFGVTIALTGVVSTVVAAIVGLVLVLLFLKPKLEIGNQSLVILAASLAVVLLVTVLSYIPPIGKSQNPLSDKAKNFPREIQLSFPISWKISVSAFRDSPFWGLGAANYLNNFTTYKPLEFNSTKFWNLRFNQAFNEYLEVLANLGGIGLLALLSLTAFFISSCVKTITLAKMEAKENLTSSTRTGLGLAVAGLTFFIILALHTSTVALWVVGLIIVAAFMVVSQKEGPRPEESKSVFARIASTVSPFQPGSEEIKVEALPSILLAVSVVLVAFILFFTGKFTLADYHHRLALNAVSKNQGLLAYNELVAAEKLNPYSDLYRTDLAQTNFALANAIAAAKAPTQASPSGSLTDQDRQNIQTLLQQSISEGRIATTLNPRSAANWEILGTIYRQISGVAQNALAFSLDAYGRAIFADPLNPILRLNVGGVYYAIKNYDLAIRFFTDAINLKPDFANGYYNLSVALKDKGDLQSAQTAAERVVTLVDKNSQDYKVATDYLNDLKAKNSAATESANLQTPTAQDKGALQQKELPKVVELPQPEKIATPPAVKKPNSTPEPTATPIP